MVGLLGASRSPGILRRNAAAAAELVFPVWRLAPDRLLARTQVVERGCEAWEEVSRYEAEGLDGRGGLLAAAESAWAQEDDRT
jgi:hypothetical protein